MVLVQQFQKIKAGIPVIFLAFPLEYYVAAAAPGTITPFKAKKKKRQRKNKKKKTEDGKGEKEE